MKRLWHWPIDPLARTVRLALGEKRCAIDLVSVLPWAQPEELASMAPGARAPVMVDTGAEEKVSAVGTHAICEYLEENLQYKYVWFDRARLELERVSATHQRMGTP